MANLRRTYEDIYKEVSEFLGTGDNPIDRDLRKAQEMVDKGYRMFLYPRNRDNGRRHYWSFLEKHATLKLVGSKWVYPLPADFDKIRNDFGYSLDSGYCHMHHIRSQEMETKRALSDSSSYPRYYSIVHQEYNKAVGQLKEVWFYEVPDQTYVTRYSYYFDPPKLSLDDDLFVGGNLYDEVILACCLAAAETKYHKVVGDMNKNCARLLEQAVQADQATKPDSCGLNLDPGIQRTKIDRPLQTIPENEVYQ